MAVYSDSVRGPRLAWVLRKLPGTVTRIVHKPPPTTKQREANPALDQVMANEAVVTEQDAGYMVYFPTGQCQRLTYQQVVAKKLDKDPDIISFESANDLKTPAGRFKLARNEEARNTAYAQMEKQVIDACLHGANVGSMISEYNPRGKLEDAKEKEDA